jgi:UDPglucose--hexose-1-phosphate uridylyltransferase
MTEMRLDALSGRWVVISEARAKRPDAFVIHAQRLEHEPLKPCPFCPGNEEATPPALETFDEAGHWQVRVLPNKYPAFEGDDPFVVENRGPVFTVGSAGGIHEVFVLSPEHQASWKDLSEAHAGLVMKAVRDRMAEHAGTESIRYSQAIVNSGREAGASVEHPHGQLMGMSFVPREIAEEQARCAPRSNLRSPLASGSSTRTRTSSLSLPTGQASPTKCWCSPAIMILTCTPIRTSMLKQSVEDFELHFVP